MIWTDRTIEEEILTLARDLSVDRMPTSTEMRENQRSGLSRAISLNGGIHYWSEKLGLKMKEKGSIWNEERIRTELLKCIDILMLERMPTAEELMSLGRNDLHIKISRTKKYSGWAEELGLEMKACETRMGHKYEDFIQAHLEELGYEVESMSTKFPYDLWVENCLKIDVKSAKAHHLFGSRAHTFALNKKNPTCDIYVCVALDEQEEIESIFVIPSHFLKIVTLNIGNDSKYNQFKDQWILVKTYVDFYKSIKGTEIQ